MLLRRSFLCFLNEARGFCENLFGSFGKMLGNLCAALEAPQFHRVKNNLILTSNRR